MTLGDWLGKRLKIKIIRPIIFIGLGLVLAAWALSSINFRPTDLRVDFLNVGQGDAALITFPSGTRWLIDGGPSANIIGELDQFVPMFDRRLTGVIATHPHADHITGLIEVLRRYRVGLILMPPISHTTPEYLQLLKEIQQRKIVAKSVDHVFLWRGSENNINWEWQFLYPNSKDLSLGQNDLNDASVVSRLVYGQTSFLFMGDASNRVENVLLAQGHELKSDVLKVGHHGSASATSALFLQAVQPKYAIISVGKKNQFGHPNAGTLARLNEAGVETYRTDKDGVISWTSDGKTIKHAQSSGIIDYLRQFTLAKLGFFDIVKAVMGTVR